MIFGKKVGKARITPIRIKIVIIFIIFMLLSNFISNYINLILNRDLQIRQLNQLLVKDLKELYIYADNQYQIMQYNNDLEKASQNIINNAEKQFTRKNSIAFGMDIKGKTQFLASKKIVFKEFDDKESLNKLREELLENKQEGSLLFTQNGKDFISVYKYHPQWQLFLVRAEQLSEFYWPASFNFILVSIIIFFITLIFAFAGVWLLRYILRYLGIITEQVLEIQKTKELKPITLEKAPNDEITYLGMSINSLVTMVDNLISIFKRFATTDVVRKAYEQTDIKLEGRQEDLTILFTDIRRFTTITETLGHNIINLLNLHYDRAINTIHEHKGMIGSIIGDALLAIYGIIDSKQDKSLNALRTADRIQRLAYDLRQALEERKKQIEKDHGHLNADEKRVYEAVRIEVGVGIDSGMVYYGNIGSYKRMTNTVIGDNVNAASRLEGLTKIYKIPIIVSERVKDEILDHNHEFYFQELDQVFVKGKTNAKRIFWPIRSEKITGEFKEKLDKFQKGLENYYKGNWEAALDFFNGSDLPCAEIFLQRLNNHEKPSNWKGVWIIKEK